MAEKHDDRIKLSDGYDYRIALPLVVVALIGILFIDLSGHKTLTLQNSSSVHSGNKLLGSQNLVVRNPLNNITKLGTKTEDVMPGQSPMTIPTASPQINTPGNSNLGSASQNALQNSGSSGASQPTQSDIENLINGTTQAVINQPVNRPAAPVGLSVH